MPYDTKDNRKAIGSMSCIVCSHCMGIDDTPATIHHVKEYPGQPRKNRHIIPLCPVHHQFHGKGVSIHDGRESWIDNFETELFFVGLVDNQLQGRD